MAQGSTPEANENENPKEVSNHIDVGHPGTQDTHDSAQDKVNVGQEEENEGAIEGQAQDKEDLAASTSKGIDGPPGHGNQPSVKEELRDETQSQAENENDPILTQDSLQVEELLEAELSLACPMCGEDSFECIVALRRHLSLQHFARGIEAAYKKHHNGRLNQTDPPVCRLCLSIFVNRDDMVAHLGADHGMLEKCAVAGMNEKRRKPKKNDAKHSDTEQGRIIESAKIKSEKIDIAKSHLLIESTTDEIFDGQYGNDDNAAIALAWQGDDDDDIERLWAGEDANANPGQGTIGNYQDCPLCGATQFRQRSRLIRHLVDSHGEVRSRLLADYRRALDMAGMEGVDVAAWGSCAFCPQRTYKQR